MNNNIEQDSSNSGIPALPFAALVIVALAALGMVIRYSIFGHLSLVYCVFAVFFSTNLLICFWEVSLYLGHDRIDQRAEHWRNLHRETGVSPAMGFLGSKVPPRKILSPAFWVDVWASYCHYDDAYKDRGSYAFNVDVANGFTSWIPTLILYAAYTVSFLPAVATGIIGAMMFWLWVYNSSLYWFSFRVSGRHKSIRPFDMWVYVFSLNFVWIVIPAFGLYVSIRLILDGNYQVLGF